MLLDITISDNRSSRDLAFGMEFLITTSSSVLKCFHYLMSATMSVTIDVASSWLMPSFSQDSRHDVERVFNSFGPEPAL